jgi:hypothetical protein
MVNVCCAREHSVQFFVQWFLHTLTAQFNFECLGPFREVVFEVIQAEPSRGMIHFGFLQILRTLKSKYLSIDRFLGADCEISHNWLRPPNLSPCSFHSCTYVCI